MSNPQYQIINKFYQKESEELRQDILNYYEQHKTGIINYLYGFQLIKHKLLENGTSYNIKGKTYHTKSILLDSSFLLPDGAAIRTMRLTGKLLGRRGGPWMIDNLNGTDFLPYFLNHLHNSSYKVNIVTLTVYDPRINNPKGYLKKAALDYIHMHRPHFNLHGEEVLYGDTNYDQFDWSGVENYLQSNQSDEGKKINLLLNFRGGSYGGPHQELFAYINKQKLQELGLLCMNQGATVDFWAGKEKRAPKRIRILRLESAYRLFSNPALNFKKFLVSFEMIGLIIRKVILKV